MMSSLVIKNQTLGDVLQLGGSSKLGTIGAEVNHERRGLIGVSSLAPQEGDDASRRNPTSVVEREFNEYGAEEIVKEHSVCNVTTGRLKEKMNMLNLRVRGDG